MQLAFPGTAADGLVACAYVLWLLITMVWVLRCRNICPGIVSTFAPSWPLFAPNPIVYDFDLAFRSKRADGKAPPWERLPMRYERAWHHAVWNPGFHEQIFVFKLCQVLVGVPKADRRTKRLRARAYQFLRSLIASRVGERPEAIQFKITRCRPLNPGSAEVVFLSANGVRGDVS
jgi:hypothetical protein